MSLNILCVVQQQWGLFSSTTSFSQSRTDSSLISHPNTDCYLTTNNQQVSALNVTIPYCTCTQWSCEIRKSYEETTLRQSLICWLYNTTQIESLHTAKNWTILIRRIFSVVKNFKLNFTRHCITEFYTKFSMFAWSLPKTLKFRVIWLEHHLIKIARLGSLMSVFKVFSQMWVM